MPHPIDQHVGRRLREARLAKSWNQERLGQTVGISFQQVQKYEKGVNRIGASRLFEFATALTLPVSWFFEDLDVAEESEEEADLTRRATAAGRKLQEIKDPIIRNEVIRLIDALHEKENR
ncbi:helix-turn-helix domain-containing protein [Pacificispira sp.]|uniref:helix-turn-helix domain-containing protein n=1 Tax=Pacificispira sp. TaxID=2888761 RepID=UPI003BA9F589